MRRFAVTWLRKVLGIASRPPPPLVSAIPVGGTLALVGASGELLIPGLPHGGPFTLHLLAVLVATLAAGPWAGATALILGAALGHILYVRATDADLGAALAVTGGYVAVATTLLLTLCALRLASRRSSRALARARRQREAVARGASLRDDFLAVAGHELKTPLAALQLQLEGLARAVRLRRPGFEGLADERLAKGLAHLQRLEGLVADMLDASRLLHGGLRLAPEPIDFAGVLEGVVARLARPAERVGSPIRLVDDGPLRGEFDPVRLEQLATHLLANAVKYGMGKPIEVALRRDGGHAVLLVRDSGMGLSAADAGRLFRRFERVAPGDHHGGLGLGLGVVRHIVESAGGSVQVDSSPGAGSTFTVRLPLVVPEGVGGIRVPVSPGVRA